MSKATILLRILARKREEVAERGRLRSIEELRAACRDASPPRGFADALAARVAAGRNAVIAEIKKASPSKGLIRADFDPVALARSYERGGAACLSVLTDVDFFQGADAYLQAARDAVRLPVLRKDFTVDAYQVLEARVLGADCILLIAAAFTEAPGHMADLAALATELGMDVLVEVHDAPELAMALAVPGRLIGINNRDLHSFETSLETTYALLDRIPSDRIVVTESGIGTAGDVAAMRAHGVRAFLVGESLMRAPDPGARLRELFG
jgi:indole-3-glycerol phosphate synthase